ncbi:phosphodiesterase [Posidoniimonas polymericola]|uniref:Phosphodiesterase n=1 Tax=Posidoniimonas polymericola TaxID=2528002 RepID=A0A5C5Y0B4_9BACT|nr:HDOD domain-containing protein [Posidoniimonas polymericola]TWT67675.1 phosphodiesterase [Posidoniimonas polymericola]
MTATSETPSAAEAAPLSKHLCGDVDPKLESLFERLHNLASPPSMVPQVLAVATREDPSAEDLRMVIEKDQALSVRLLTLINSSYYGLRNEVSDLQTAVSLLGVDKVKNVALTIAMSEQFKAPSVVGNLDPRQLWDHSVSTAAVARLISGRCGIEDPEAAYLAGLVHDLGLNVLEQHMPEHAPRVYVRFTAGQDWVNAEQEVLEFDHAQLGAYLASKVGFGRKTVEAIEFHHAPMAAPERSRDLAALIAAANYLVTRCGHGSVDRRRIMADDAIEHLNLTNKKLRELWEDLDATLQSVSELTHR